MSKKEYKYILMDLDGTISDSSKGIIKGVLNALNYFGIEVKDEDSLLKFIGPPLSDSFKDYYNLSDEDTEIAIKKYREYYSEKGLFENDLYDGMADFLIKAKESGKKIILATSKPETFSVKILEHFKVKEYFDFVAGSTLDGSRSKKEDVIKYAIDEMKIPVDEAIMIGDRHYDIEGAKKNDLDSIGVLYGFGNKEELENAGANYIAKTVDDLYKILNIDNSSNYMIEGMSIGMCLGIAIGQFIYKNMALGLSMGMCIGLGIGSCIKKK